MGLCFYKCVYGQKLAPHHPGSVSTSHRCFKLHENRICQIERHARLLIHVSHLNRTNILLPCTFPNLAKQKHNKNTTALSNFNFSFFLENRRIGVTSNMAVVDMQCKMLFTHSQQHTWPFSTLDRRRPDILWNLPFAC